MISKDVLDEYECIDGRVYKGKYNLIIVARRICDDEEYLLWFIRLGDSGTVCHILRKKESVILDGDIEEIDILYKENCIFMAVNDMYYLRDVSGDSYYEVYKILRDVSCETFE